MPLQRLLDAWLAPTDVATFREEFFGRRALFRAGTPERLAPVLALSSWNIREILAQRTSSVVARFQCLERTPCHRRCLARGGTATLPGRHHVVPPAGTRARADHRSDRRGTGGPGIHYQTLFQGGDFSLNLLNL